MAKSSPTRRAALLLPALIGLALVLPLRTVALTRIAPSMAELIDASDVIVAGVLPKDSATIEVSSYLRGSGSKRVETSLYSSPDDGYSPAFPFDEPGVFFLRRHDGELWATAWKAFSPDRSYVQSLMYIARDPGPFLSSPQWRRNTDVIEFIGRRFDSFKVTSADAPDLADWLVRQRVDPFPWSMQGRRAITMTTAAAEPYHVKGDGTGPGELLAAALNRHAADWKGSATRRATPPRFTLQFDTRRPMRWGSIGPHAGLEVLEEAVRSRTPWVAPEALWVLSRLRAVEAVPYVIPLLNHEDPENDPRRDVAHAAIGFLGRSRDRRAPQALNALLAHDTDDSTIRAARVALACLSEAPSPYTRCY